MKRDMDLVRLILLAVETAEQPNQPIVIVGRNPIEIGYHVEIMHELLTGVRRPAGDETGIEWRGAAGGEVGFVLVHTSPRMSWTRGLSSTPDCATGRSPAPEHVS